MVDNIIKNDDSYLEQAEHLSTMIDDFMLQGCGRLKINMSENINEGQVVKQYHHGRCDINSPFACGSSFDLLE